MTAGVVSALMCFDSSGVRRKREAGPLQRRAILADHVASVVAVLLSVLQENLDRLDSHGAIAKDRHARNLSRLHQMLEDKNKFLGTFDGKCGDDDAAAALCCRGNELRQFRHRIFFGMRAVAVRRFHHHQVGDLALRGTGMHHFSRSDFLIAHAANVAGEQQSSRLTVGAERDLRHAGPENVRGANETERQIAREWNVLAHLDRLEILQRVLRFREGVKRQRRIVLRLLRLVVEAGVFFLQVARSREE